MSEQSGGPGWWLASDGKWYPPEQAPTAAQPTTDPTTADPTATQPAAGAPTSGLPPYAAPGAGAAAGGAGGGGASKVIAIVVAVALIAGGGAFLLTRGDGNSGSTASFCDTAKKFKDDADLNKAFNDPAKLDKTVAAFDNLTKTAPSEIKNDMNTLNDAVKKIAAAVKSAGSDPSKALGAILATSASLDENKLKAAQQNIEKFGKEKCGIDFSASSSDSSSSFSFSDSFSFDSSSLESSLSSQFSSFDSSSLESSLSSQSSSLCSEFSDLCSSGS